MALFFSTVSAIMESNNIQDRSFTMEDHYTSAFTEEERAARRRKRQDSNRLAQKDACTEHCKKCQEEQQPRPLFLPDGKRTPADPVDHAAGGE